SFDELEHAHKRADLLGNCPAPPPHTLGPPDAGRAYLHDACRGSASNRAGRIDFFCYARNLSDLYHLWPRYWRLKCDRGSANRRNNPLDSRRHDERYRHIDRGSQGTDPGKSGGAGAAGMKPFGFVLRKPPAATIPEGFGPVAF